MVPPKGEPFARCGSTWIHWKSSMALAKVSMRSWPTSTQGDTATSSPTRPASSLIVGKSALREAVVLELLAQRELRELAGRRVRQLAHEHDVVRHPPLGDLALVELEQLVPGDLLPGLFHGHDDRPLVPLRMLHADHGRFGDRRMGDGDVLEVDGADPFPAGLDHVLRAVGDLDVAFGIDVHHVAGGEPALLERIAAFALEIALDHPWAAHMEVPDRLSVPRKLAAVLAHRPEVHPVDRAPLLVLQRVALLLALSCVLRLEGTHRAERAHLGHAPGVQHLDAEFLLEGARHRRRAGRAADHYALERGEPKLLLAHVVEKPEPHGGHARAHRDLFGFEKLMQALAVEVLDRKSVV